MVSKPLLAQSEIKHRVRGHCRPVAQGLSKHITLLDCQSLTVCFVSAYEEIRGYQNVSSNATECKVKFSLLSFVMIKMYRFLP